MIDCVKVQSHLLFLIWPIWNLFCTFWTIWSNFLVGVSFKTFLGLTNVDNHLWFLEVQPYCQAQPQLQLSWAEIFFNVNLTLPTHQPTQPAGELSGKLLA